MFEGTKMDHMSISIHILIPKWKWGSPGRTDKQPEKNSEDPSDLGLWQLRGKAYEGQPVYSEIRQNRCRLVWRSVLSERKAERNWARHTHPHPTSVRGIQKGLSRGWGWMHGLTWKPGQWQNHPSRTKLSHVSNGRVQMHSLLQNLVQPRPGGLFWRHRAPCEACLDCPTWPWEVGCVCGCCPAPGEQRSTRDDLKGNQQSGRWALTFFILLRYIWNLFCFHTNF